MSTTKKKSKAPVGESKVRAYLAFLADPASTVNQTAVSRAYKAYEKETDPIAKIEKYEAWQEVSTPDGSKVEADFIEVALRWATEKDISADTLIAQGVPRDVLREAGFDGVRTGVYKPRVTTAQTRDWILLQEDVITVLDVVAGCNASESGARNTLNSMIEAGEVERLPNEKTGESGRAAVRYRVV